MTLALLPPTYEVSSFYLLRIYKLGFLFSKHITTALVWDPAVSCRAYCNRLPIYFPQCYQSDLSKNAILSCQFKKKKNSFTFLQNKIQTLSPGICGISRFVSCLSHQLYFHCTECSSHTELLAIVRKCHSR